MQPDRTGALGGAHLTWGTMIYAGLFLSAFTSATLLPGSSEAALLVLLAAGMGNPVLLVTAATFGNVLGSLVNWGLGRFLSIHLRNRPWSPISSKTCDRAIDQFRIYGHSLLLLSWVPVIGDPLTLAAGMLRVPLIRFIVVVSIGKAGRYGAILAGFTWWNG